MSFRRCGRQPRMALTWPHCLDPERPVCGGLGMLREESRGPITLQSEIGTTPFTRARRAQFCSTKLRAYNNCLWVAGCQRPSTGGSK